MLEGVDFKVSYKYLKTIKYLRTIITIASAEGMIIFILDIVYVFKNNILPNPEEIFYIILPHLYLEFFNRKWPKYTLATHNPK